MLGSLPKERNLMFDFDKYEKVVTSAIYRKNKGIATQEDIALIELFEYSCDITTLCDFYKERVAVYHHSMDKAMTEQVKFWQGNTWLDDDIKNVLKPYIDSSKFG